MAGEGQEAAAAAQLDGQPLPEVVARPGSTDQAPKFSEQDYGQYRRWRRAYDEHSRYKRRVNKWLEDNHNYQIADSSGWLDVAEAEGRCNAEINGEEVKIFCDLCAWFQFGYGKKFDVTQIRSMSSRYDRERRARR
jgi:hypothetical protein